jgi:DNA-directed RNA polymerase subunit M/transcription elongation factor TFIIS
VGAQDQPYIVMPTGWRLRGSWTCGECLAAQEIREREQREQQESEAILKSTDVAPSAQEADEIIRGVAGLAAKCRWCTHVSHDGQRCSAGRPPTDFRPCGCLGTGDVQT